MSEQKQQSLADFVFENKDKIPDNIYKILMEQYAKKDELKGYVEVEYFKPTVVWVDKCHRDDDGSPYHLVFDEVKTIVKKYDDRFDGEHKQIKIGKVPYGRVCQNMFNKTGIFNQINVLRNTGLSLRPHNEDDIGDEYKEIDNHLYCNDVIVTSMKEL
jgi:hypothetical protein